MDETGKNTSSPERQIWKGSSCKPDSLPSLNICRDDLLRRNLCWILLQTKMLSLHPGPCTKQLGAAGRTGDLEHAGNLLVLESGGMKHDETSIG